MDRYEETKRTLDVNLSNHGAEVEIELLWCDNGSQDPRMFTLVDKYKPAYFRGNKTNEGVARGFNQLYLRSGGDYIVLMGNDIVMPKGWLKEMIAYADFVPKSGLIGVKCTAEIPILSSKFNCFGHFLDQKIDKVFGDTLFRRELVEDLGLFCEQFDVYGLEDSNFNDRVNLAGYNSLYVPNMVSDHIGGDVGTASDYRKMKDQSLHANAAIFGRLREEMRTGARSLREPLPEPRDPL